MMRFDRGEHAEPMGILQRWVVTPKQVKDAGFAHRGAGVFYRLKEPGSEHAAAARPVSKH